MFPMMKNWIFVIALTHISSLCSAQTLKANFSCDPDSTVMDPYIMRCVYKFVDQSTGNPTSWFWNFDGTFASTLENPRFTPPDFNDTITIMLIVQDAVGDLDTAYYTLLVNPDCSCSGLVGIDNNLDKFSIISISPNPVYSKTLIKLDERFSTSVIRSYNSFGLLVREENIVDKSQFYMYRDDLINGIYFLQIENKKGESTAILFVVN